MRVAYAMDLARSMDADQTIVINLSGRGIKTLRRWRDWRDEALGLACRHESNFSNASDRIQQEKAVIPYLVAAIRICQPP